MNSTGIRTAAILGAGSWGTALATLTTKCDHVSLWTRSAAAAAEIQAARVNHRYLSGITLPSNVHVTADLSEAVRSAQAVVFAIPCSGMYQLAAAVGGLLHHAALLVSAAKGLDDPDGLRMSQVITRALGTEDAPIAALSGPNLALELARGLPGASVAAANDEASAGLCRDLFTTPWFRIYTSLDLVGVELAGAMKNVIAIGAGLCEGVGYGDNARAAFMTRGLAEITRLGLALGASAGTFLGLAGVGDLIATGGSRLSRNYRVGLGLGQGRALDDILADLGQVAEGVPTTRAICSLAARTGVEMPLCEALYAVLFNGTAVADCVAALMARPARSES